MRFSVTIRTSALMCAFLPLQNSLAQNANTGADILAAAKTAFSGGHVIQSVTMQGQAKRIAGSAVDNGSVSLTAGADGSYQWQFSENAVYSETKAAYSAGGACTVAVGSAAPEAVASQNCLSPLTWFLPMLSLAGGQQASTVVTTLVGPGTTLRQSDSLVADAIYTHITTVDLVLDPATSLPTTLLTNIHPDANANVDIPVKVVFSNYQAIDGVQIPFRIQRYINGVLQLDVTLSSATTH